MRFTKLLRLLALAPLPLAAQRTLLVVDVGETQSGAFVQDALIRLPDVGRVARTNWHGEARIEHLAPGDYRVQVRKFGFAPSEVTMRLSGDTATAFFELERVATSLDTVRITAAFYSPHLQELDTHRRLGIARIIPDTVLATARNQSLAVLLTRRFPVSIVDDTMGQGTWTVGRLAEWQSQQAQIVPCTFFLDGFKFYDPLETLKPDDLVGVEYYTNLNAPVQYRAQGVGPCVILMWERW